MGKIPCEKILQSMGDRRILLRNRETACIG